MKEKLDFSNLIPEFRLLWEGDIPVASAQGFSTLIVVILLMLMGGCLLFAIWQWAKAHAQVRFYRKTLRAYKPEQLFASRREINEKMASRTDYGGLWAKLMAWRTDYNSLWREFDESLVCANGCLYNTLDAAHFFNHYSLARGLTDNRLLAAVPSFLTAIGVIGTFAGLQIGLSEIKDAGFGSVDSGVDEIKAGIGGMIAGAAIAFMTSVWGIGSSVVFNFIEKILERSIRASISRLQNQIDSLYQRLTAEKSLADIEGHNRESREIMQTLAEKIGDQMQKALLESTDKIKNSLVESLENILGPNIEKLANNANAGAEKALNDLVERFMEAIGREGQRQGKKMDEAAANIKRTLGDVVSESNDFLNRLDQRMEDIVDKIRSIIEILQSHVTGQIEKQQQQANRRDQELIGQIEQLQGSQGNLNQMIEKLSTQQQRMLEQILVILGESESMANHNQAVGKQLDQTANAFGEQVSALRELSQSLREASTALSGDIRKAIQAAQTLMQQNERIGKRSEEILVETQQLSQSLLSATNTLDKTAGKSTEGLQQVEQHFKALTERLKQHNEEFSEKVARLLSDYADHVSGQTRERLNQWNKQTQKYTNTMTNAIQALNEVVEEIEGKIKP